MDLYELKEKIDEAQKGQLDAAKAVISELDKLDVPHNYYFNKEYFLREVGKRKEYLQIYSSSTGIDLKVIWWVGCYEAECDDRDCDGEHRVSRKATPDEVVFVVDNYLRKKLRGILKENARLREVGKALNALSQV